MNETLIVLRVKHKDPLPADATDVVAQRFYGWALNKGVAVDVTATLATIPKQPGEAE
jgi:hypothetical protein